MPRHKKGRIGRIKRKGTNNAKYDYIRKTPEIILIRQLSPKRSRHHRLGTTFPIYVMNDIVPTLRNPPETKRICYRIAIYYYYIEVLDAPHLIHWKSRAGTIAIIRKALKMHPSQRRVIKRTLEEIMRCATEGVDFNGKIEKKNKEGRKIIILPGSFEELLIANWMEAYCGFRQTTVMVNEHRRQQGDENVSVYTVMATFYRLQPKIDVLTKVQSGGEKQGWINARYNVSKQMEAMQDKLTEEEKLTDITGNISTRHNYLENICQS